MLMVPINKLMQRLSLGLVPRKLLRQWIVQNLHAENAHTEVKILTESSLDQKDGHPPDPPVNCCMSGCANCVWIQYAEEMLKFYKDGGCKAREIIQRSVADPSLKAFLLSEIKCNE